MHSDALATDSQPVTDDAEASPSSNRVRVGDADGVVLTENLQPGVEGCYAPRDADEHFDRVIHGTWMPSTAALLEFDQALRVFVASRAGRSVLARRVLSYRRQYEGILCGRGYRALLVNLLCAESPSWQSQWVVVHDGGDCYPMLWYNTDDHQVEMVMVGGTVRYLRPESTEDAGDATR